MAVSRRCRACCNMQPNCDRSARAGWRSGQSRPCRCRSGGNMSAILFGVFFVFLARRSPLRMPFLSGPRWAYCPVTIFLCLALSSSLPANAELSANSHPVLHHGGGIDDDWRLGQHLIDFATDLVGRFRGGHAQVSVLGSTLFGGVSGSAVADATALGKLLIPWQIKVGYPRAFCGATIAAASTIDILIPPSIPLILYSLVSNASIGALFFAGIVPGLLLAVGFTAVCNISARLRDFPYERRPVAWGRLAQRGLYAMPALLMPVLVLIALRLVFSPPPRSARQRWCTPCWCQAFSIAI